MKIELTSADLKGFAVKVNGVFIGYRIYMDSLDARALRALALCTSRIYKDRIETATEAREVFKRDVSELDKVVNGMDKADLIAGYAVKFEAALLDAEFQPPRPDVEPVQKSEPAWAWFARAWAAIVEQLIRKWRL